MNNRRKIRGMSALMVLSSLVMIAGSVQAEADNESTVAAYKNIAAGIALGSVSYTHLTLPTKA